MSEFESESQSQSSKRARPASRYHVPVGGGKGSHLPTHISSGAQAEYQQARVMPPTSKDAGELEALRTT